MHLLKTVSKLSVFAIGIPTSTICNRVRGREGRGERESGRVGVSKGRRAGAEVVVPPFVIVKHSPCV